MTYYAISTKTSAQSEWETNWEDQPSAEAAMDAVRDIQQLPEDYRQIAITKWENGAPMDFKRFFRVEYKGEWSEVK